MCLVSWDDLNVNVDIPLKKLFDAGYDGRDFSGISGFMERVDISEEDRKRLLKSHTKTQLLKKAMTWELIAQQYKEQLIKLQKDKDD